MAVITQQTPPSPEGRELDRIRAMQPSTSPQLTPSIGYLVLRGALQTLILWAVLVFGFLGIWFMLAPMN